MRRLEGAAYCAVLRAFYAQSAHFTVERMDLLETLRIELNIPATEYLTQLRKLEQDERLKGLQQLAATRTGTLEPPKKKHRKNAEAPGTGAAGGGRKGIGGRPPAKKPAAAGPKGKASPPAVKPTRSATPRQDGIDHVGKKVKVFWAEEGWFDAVISDYNITEGTHCVVYDIGTPDESFNWENLDELMSKGALKFMTGRVDLLKTVPTTAAASNGDSLAKISQEQSEDKLADMQQQMEEKERLLKEKLKALEEDDEDGDDDSDDSDETGDE